jgi:hypothetical protein
MFRTIPEPDWKLFKEIHTLLLERYCQRTLEELDQLRHKDAVASDRYFDIRELMKKRDKTLQKIFQDYRRSTAIMQLAAMRNAELLSEAEFGRFSEETQLSIKHWTGEA